MRQQVGRFDHLGTDQKIEKLTNFLINHQLIKNFHIIPSPPDEPLLFLFSCSLKLKNSHQYVSGTGVSIKSKEIALLKCLAEAIERYSLCINKEVKISYININNKSVWHTLKSESRKITCPGWVKGLDLTTNKPVDIPAQLIYLDYKNRENEKLITQRLSTGAAFGSTRYSTLLRGIYELVERDAFLTVFLNQISATQIRLRGKTANEIIKLIKNIEKYNLEVKIFDIKNDLGIPTFACMIIDKTGFGPSCSFGLKSSLNENKAILGAIEESLHIRLWVRSRMVEQKFKQKSNKASVVSSQEDRMMYWAPIDQLKKLDFLLSPVKKTRNYSENRLNETAELQKVLSLFKKKKYHVYYCDVAPGEIKEMGGFIYKVVIPSLQPFYIDEKLKVINQNRLVDVAKYFNKSVTKPNPIPHPFL